MASRLNPRPGTSKDGKRPPRQDSPRETSNRDAQKRSKSNSSHSRSGSRSNPH